MLSAFTARPIIELKQRDKSKIETILAYGDRVLVGLNTGSLRIYRVNDVSPPESQPPNTESNGTSSRPASKSGPPAVKPTDLLREVEKFSSRAIEQLAIIKEANTIVSLSAYQISLHDLSSYELVETLTRTKNATCFAVTSNIVKDAATGIPEIISRLAVAVKRRLLLWNWHESELSEDVTEIVLSEAVRSVTWATATKIVCGMNAGYVMVDIETSAVTEINGSGAAAAGGQGSRFGASMGYMGLGGYMPKPLAVKLADGEMLLAKDINSLFIDAEGKPLDKRQIPWQAAPDGIGYNYPYILALQPPSKGSLEVWNPDTLSLLQAITLPGAAQLHFAPPTVSLAHAAKGFHVSSDRAVWKMDATDYDSQIAELIEQKKYDEAISVLSMLEDALLTDKTGTMREVKMLKAEVLFRAKKYRSSLDLFNEDDVHAPPERVLKLYPRMIAGVLSAEAQQEDTSASEPEQGEESQEQSSDEGKASDEKPAAEDTAAVVEAAASPNKGGAFARYWPMGGGQKKADSDTASITSKNSKIGTASTDKDGDAASVNAPKTSAAIAGDAPLEGQDLLDAVRELNSYLAGTRARLQRVLDPSTGKLKRQSTTTSAATNTTSNSVDTSFLVDPAQLDSDQKLEESIKSTFTLVDTTLFRAYMFSQPKLAGSLFRIANFCDPKVVNEMLLENHRYSELVDFFYGKKLHREALTLLRRFGTAPEESGKEEHESKGLVTWLKPKLGASDEKGEDEKADGKKEDGHTNGDAAEIPINASEIPPQLRGTQRTILYLQSLPPDMVDLVLEFSDWVLRRDPDAGMEVFLADSENAETLPRDQVVKFLSNIDEKLELRYLEHILNELGDGTPDFHNRIVQLMVKMLKEMPNEETEEKEQLAEKLVHFLKEGGRGGRQYSLGKAYELLPRDDPIFYEPLAIVLSNRGSDKQALEIYVFKMQDYDKAEEYETTCSFEIILEFLLFMTMLLYQTTNAQYFRYCNRIHMARSDSPTTSTTPWSPTGPRESRPTSPNQKTDEDDKDDDPDSNPSIYNTLLSLYLTPPPPHKPNLDPALDLLSKHGSRLPAASTLSLIPNDLPVKELESYFFSRIRAANSKLAESRIVEGLRRAMLVDTQALLLLGDGLPGGYGGRSRQVLVGEEKVCGVCHKRLSNSVVAVLPDNGVVHYGCLGRSGKGSVRGTGAGRTVVAGAWARSSG
ncbi:hypothetical protein BX600DRAFT_532573 [Xylariales sp. PMI_506]|nr:hypothetical protein BX600DRAFT_532573 [Xylariales sp. PMI_506]